MRYYCTYFDKNYVVKGLALIDSLIRHEKNDFMIFVVCLDEITRTILDKLNQPNVKTIPFHEIEHKDLPLLEAKRNRSLKEYYWTCTPTIILRIMQRNPQIDILTYMDADLYYYSSPDPIFAELGDHSILIHEHRFSKAQKSLENFGKYNVGLLCFRNDSHGLAALNWWRDRCNEWCFARLEDGKYADQLYLNDWPTRFDRVVVLQHVGAGVGPWNHIQYQFRMDAGNTRLTVNNLPMVFYHFHSFTFVNPFIIIPSKYATNPLTMDILQFIFLPYMNALSSALEKIYTVVPKFNFGLINENELGYKHTFLAKNAIAADLMGLAMPQCRISVNAEWDCWCSEQLLEYASRLGQIQDHLNLKDISAATAAIKAAYAEFPDSADLKLLQTKLHNDESKRQAELEVILQQHPNSALAHNEIGVLLYENGDKEKALHHYEKAAGLRPDNLIFQKNLANYFYVESGRLEEAKNIYLRIVAYVPDDITSLLTLGNILIDLEKLDEAAGYFSRVLNIDPDNEIARKCIAILRQTSPALAAPRSAEQKYADMRPLMDAGNYEAVIQGLEDILVDHPEFAIAHTDLGVLYYNGGNLEKAQMHYEKAVTLEPQNLDFLRNLAAFYLHGLGKIESALKIYLKVLEIQPKDTEVLIILGNICTGMQNTEDARFFLNKVLEIEPWNKQAWHNLENLETSLSEEPAKSGEQMYQEIRPLMDEHRYEEVIEALSALLEVYPGFAMAHSDLGVLHYNEKNLEKARMHFEKAAQLEPDNLSYQKNLASFYYQGLGQFEDALQIFLRIMKTNPKDIETLTNLGNICRILQNNGDASFFYNQVLDLDPLNESARNYLQESANTGQPAVNY